MLNLTGGGLSGGYQKYVQRIVEPMRHHSAISDLLVVSPPEYVSLARSSTNVWTWQNGEQMLGFPLLRQRVRTWRPDVVFIPTARYLNCGVPVVCMVRNMEPMLPATLGDGFTLWAKGRLRALLAKRATARATRVVAVSQFVHDFLINQWNVKANRVGIVYHGVDSRAPVAANPDALRSLSGKPFLFTAGSLLPYRGLEDAISALPKLASREVKLVVAGDGLNAYGQAMRALAVRRGVADRVVWLGHVNETVMNSAFRQCAAFLMTSRVEACPNTALEAMANAALCISTTCPPMPEFFRNTALYYEAGDALQLARHIDHAIAMPARAMADLRTASQQRAAEFTWTKTVNETVAQLTLALHTQ